MVAADPTFNGQDIYVYRYPSKPFGRSLTVDEIADNMHIVLMSDDVLRHDELTFVCHSMGGLVTRAYILKYRNEVVQKIRLLYFFATPTTGASLATLASLVSRNPQLKQLYSMDVADSYVGVLQSNWLAADLRLKSYCAYETQPLPALRSVVVERQSATNLCTQPPIAIEADHIGIVKPPTRDSITYRALKVAFLEVPTLLKTAKPPTQGSGRAVTRPVEANPSPAKKSGIIPNKQLASRCGPVPPAQAAPLGTPSESVSVVVTRSNSGSGANVRDFVTTGRGRYDVDMLIPDWRPVEMEFRLGNWFQVLQRQRPPFSLAGSGHPVTISSFTNYGFEIDDSGCAGIPFSVVWLQGEPLITAPKLWITSPPEETLDIPRETSVEVRYENAPLAQYLWLVVDTPKGGSWPWGICTPDNPYIDGSSMITRTRERGVWQNPPGAKVYVGGDGEEGPGYAIRFMLVDEDENASLREIVKNQCRTKFIGNGVKSIRPISEVKRTFTRLR
jgi:hypothetical protein